ncbi:MAG: hypothetical protein ACJAUH_000287 [Saprospiraceae bacterium]|jgi:hypothetical protein
MNCKLLKLKKMNLKSIIILSCLCCFSCSDNPIKEYQLDKEALIKAQNDYENSTTQHQKVQSKSIITITKNETKVLAMVEIYQNWELDTLERKFRPVKNEAEAKLTYFDGYCEVTFCISKILQNDNKDQYQLMESMLSNPMYENSIDLGTIETIPITVDLNNQEFKDKNCPSFTRRHGTIFESEINKHEIIMLKVTDSDIYSKKVDNNTFTFDFTHTILTDINEMKNLNRNQRQL